MSSRLETTTNKGQIYVVVCTVALLAIVSVSVVCALSYLEIKIPPELQSLAVGLVGYLTGSLTKTTPTETIKTPPVPAEVVVANKPDDPVPTTETKP